MSTKSSRDKPPEAFPERDPIRKVELSPSCGGNDRDRDPGPLRFPLPWVVAWCGAEVGGDFGVAVAMTGDDWSAMTFRL